MFEKCDDSFIKALVRLLQPQVLLCGDYAFKVYELGSTMYFIQNGCIQIVNHQPEQFHHLVAAVIRHKSVPKLCPREFPRMFN